MLMVLTMILALIPASAFAQIGPVIEPNFGFVPNSGEASVSKVDLVSKTEVARYYTEPRVSPSADYNWRTSRIAMDTFGNAWVLNTGADGVNLQGSVVRIQADTTGLVTHSYPDPVLDFGTDEAVKVFDIGNPGDMPRAIAIDSDGFIWIGFYSSGALMKFSFDGANLIQIGETIYNEGNKLNYYEMKFAPDGNLYISSRNSTPSRSGNSGVWSFNPSTGIFTEEWDVDSPYSLLIDPVSGQVYATSYSNVLWIKGTGTVAITGAQNLRGMVFDGLGKIWIASTTGGSGGDRVCWYDIGAGTSGYITLPIGTTPVGVGIDEAGLMWAVCRTDGVTEGGYLVAFDPEDGSPQGSIRVGYRPYAYGDFVMPIPRYCIEGTKLEDFFTGDKTREPLEGWSIYLYNRVLEPEEVPGVATVGLLASTITDEFGDYKFCGLIAGTYYVYEMFDDCYGPFEPANGMRTVTLPTVGNDGNAVDQDFINRRGVIQGIKFKDVLQGETLEGWEILLYKGEPAVGTPNNVDAFASTLTDSQGFYKFTELCPDTYFVYEVMKDGWVQTYPSNGFWEVELAAGTRATGKFFVNEEERYGFCGFKLDADTRLGLEGWTIILRDAAGMEVARTTTDVNGKYCFAGLRAGTYTVEEVGMEGWEQVFPGGIGKHIITLPATLNLIVNGDFEAGNFGFTSQYDFITEEGQTGGDNGLGTLDREEAYAIGTDPNLYHKLWSSFKDHTSGSGKMMIINGSTEKDVSVWFTSTDIIPGTDYTFSFWSRSSYDKAIAEVDVWINGEYQATFTGPVDSWAKHSLDWNAGTANSAKIEFICNTSQYDGTDFALDDISLIGKPSYNFENRITSGKVPAFKFYDTNLNGVFDEGEKPIAGWKIQIFKGDDLIETKFTDINGEVMFTVPYGDYTIKEVMPLNKCWIPTTPMERPVTVERNETSDRVEFGNVCIGEGGGKTLGFWSNKNGQKIFEGTDKGASSLEMLRGLNLRDASGNNFDPTTYTQFRTWLLGGNATNMSYMLSVQLSAMKLNVAKGLVNGEAMIYVPLLTDIANPVGFASVNSVMAAADAELGLHGTAFSEDAWRSYQGNLKNALDDANNNMIFLQSKPCSIAY